MSLLNSYRRAQLQLGLACIVCFTLFWYVGKALAIPVHPGYEASLLQQPSALLGLLIVAVVFAACLLIGTAIGGTVRHTAGLLAASAGLAALSVRGGSSRYVLFWAMEHGGSPAIFWKLATETAALGLLVAAGGWLLQSLYAKGTIRDRLSDLPTPPAEESLRNELGAVVLAGLTVFLGVLLLAPAEGKQQVLAAVFISSAAGAALARYLFPTGPRSWHWLAPILVGIIGYILVGLSPEGVATGGLAGRFAPLARPLPLDYASAGPAGALVGYWLERSWQVEGQEHTPAESQASQL